jgi:transposase
VSHADQECRAWRGDDAVIQPMLPNKPRGVPRVDDRGVLNGIFWVLRSGAPWRDLPENCGPPTTCYNRFVRWRQAGVWDRIMDALAAAHEVAVQMIDTFIVRVHQHGAYIARNPRQSMGRSRGEHVTATPLILLDWYAGCRTHAPVA